METTTTRVITIPDYSKQRTTHRMFNSGGHIWSVRMYITDTDIGFSVLDTRESCTKISVEILDQSGEHAIFHKEETLYNYIAYMVVPRRELEASSCVRNDSLTVRFTLSFLTPSLSEPTMIFQEPKVVLAGSHILTIDNFSNKPALMVPRCIRSARFCVGGSTWYIKLCRKGPKSTFLSLTRASSDEPAVTIEFNFKLLAGHDGGYKYHEFTKVTRMFNRASPKHTQLVPRTLMAKCNQLIVRCHLVVIKTEMPTPRSESVLTPLSRRSSCLATIKAGIKLTIDSFSKHKAVIKAKSSTPRSESLLTPLLGCHDVRSA